MRLFNLQDLIYFSKDKHLILKNPEGEEVGFVSREAVEGYEKNHVFSYTSFDRQNKITLGIRRSGFKRIVMAEYEVHVNGNVYELKDKIGNNFLYFCVTGRLEDQLVHFEENWEREVEVTIQGQNVASIRENKKDLRAAFQFNDEVEERSVLFGSTILMYFMLKIYRKESGFLEDFLT